MNMVEPAEQHTLNPVLLHRMVNHQGNKIAREEQPSL